MAGKLTITKGLPGSGKSTWAAAQLDAVVITKDDIRAELKKDWSYDVEKEVLRIRDFKISEGLSKGKWVISADTNLAKKHEARLREIAKRYKVPVEVKSFLDVPLETCVAQDALREPYERVGRKVIEEMERKYLQGHYDEQATAVESTEPIVVKYVPKPGTPSAIIVDIDGTVALHVERNPYDVSKYHTDAPNAPIIDIVKAFDRQDDIILFVSGRDERYRDVTAAWLAKHTGLGSNLIMRPAHDVRNDAVVKLELFDAHIRDKYNVRFVLDDRDRVVKAWRSIGLTCLQVAPGDF